MAGKRRGSKRRKWQPKRGGVLIVGNAPGGNYREKVLRQARQLIGLGPGPHHVDIAHDDWCSIWSGGKCDCNPDVVMRSESLRGSIGHEEGWE